MATQPDFDPAEELADGEAMPDHELVSILREHEMQAIGYQPGSSDEISSEQQQALDYYYRRMDDVPAAEGSSSVVDGTVQVVVDNALAAVLKPFVSSDETVRFSPRGPEDIEQAEQATEYVNYVFNYDNPGFLITHNWFKDGLLTKLGVVKAWWESNLTLDQRETLIESDIHAQMLRNAPDYLGEQDGVAFHGQQSENGRVKVENVPPEEFRISPMSRSVETAIYAAHVPANITRSDIQEMGFDPEIVEALPAFSMSDSDNQIRSSRYQDERAGESLLGVSHPSQDRIAIRDEYVRIDYNGDGIAELRRIVRVEDTILLNDEVDESPFATVCPVPMPHKVFGLSLADLVIELQRINTVLWRQMLDNLYKSNNPRPVVSESAERADGSTPESLGDPAPGAAITVRDINGLRFDAVPYTAAASMPMLELIGGMIEERTGISRTGQGLDTNSLRKAGQMTATEMAMIAGGKNARVEMIARIFAETGVKRLFRIILGLVTKHQDKARMIRLRNKWVEVDPRSWPEMDMEVSVGLGIGEKSEQISQADAVLQTMEVLGQSPYASLIDQKTVYNAVKRKFTAAGIKNTEEYLVDPSQNQQQPQQEKPDPAMAKVQAEAAAAQRKQAVAEIELKAKLTLQEQEQMKRQELAQQQAEFDANLAHQKAEFEAQLATERAQRESQLAQDKFDREVMMAERKWQVETLMQAREADSQEQADVDLSENRPGGALDE